MGLFPFWSSLILNESEYTVVLLFISNKSKLSCWYQTKAVKPDNFTDKMALTEEALLYWTCDRI